MAESLTNIPSLLKTISTELFLIVAFIANAIFLDLVKGLFSGTFPETRGKVNRLHDMFFYLYISWCLE